MLKDVQAQKDLRHIPLKHVGIKDLRWPIQLKDPKNGVQHSVATVKLAVDLPHEQRGTHMSRFVECLKLMGPVHPHGLEAMLDTLKEKLGAQKALIELDFPYFIEKQAPVSGQTSFLDVSCHYRAEKGEKFLLDVGVDVPIHTLCPCSKEISEYSAHNQRANVSIQIRRKKFMWIEDLVEIAEQSASSPVYSLLKRPDEKYVTEHAYDNPRFVEDVCREAKLRVDRMRDVKEYCIEVESLESIHNHSAYAMVTGGEEI